MLDSGQAKPFEWKRVTEDLRKGGPLEMLTIAKLIKINVLLQAYGTLRNETKRNEMVLCEMVLCETVLCETVTQTPMRLNFSRWRRNPEN